MRSFFYGGAMQKLLVVDDSVFQRKIICQILIDSGYDVVEAEDGLDAIEKLHHTSFDGILTDLLMPNMDGITLIATLKNQGVQTPLFVLTADIQESRRQTCLEMGVTGFISKPPRKAELLDVIAIHLTSGKG